MGLDTSWLWERPGVWVVVGVLLVGLGIGLAVQGAGIGYALIAVGAVIAALALLARTDEQRNSSRVND